MKTLLLFIMCAILCLSCKNEVKKENKYDEDVEVRDPKLITETENPKISTTANAIASANGLQNWNRIKEIKFTFNVDRDTLHFERSWTWKPKENIVSMVSQKDTITYNRNKIDSTSQRADQGFINDKYWLLAPFNLVWDADSFTSKHEAIAPAPISGKNMQKFTIVYNTEGGYTPGDAYDFYFEGDFIIKEWVFREKNAKEPSLITSWEDYQTYNGIKIAKTHRKKEENWNLHFTNIEVITE